MCYHCTNNLYFIRAKYNLGQYLISRPAPTGYEIGKY